MESTVIHDVSFVIVARNESFGIRKCLPSILSMQLDCCEIICVDSGSTDDTLCVMMEHAAAHSFIRVYRCTGEVNSAIARNVGLGNAAGKYVFFVDGDVEISPAFVRCALESLDSSEADAVTGSLSEIYYTPEYDREVSRVNDRFRVRARRLAYHSGGCFIARLCVAKRVGPWDEQMARNQDIDYTLRLSRIGRFLAIPVSMGTHHTRVRRELTTAFLRRGYPLYFGRVIRRNLDRPRALIDLVEVNRGLVLGMVVHICLILSILLTMGNVSLGIAALLSSLGVLLGDLSLGPLRGQRIADRFLSHYVYILLVAAGLFVRERGVKPSVQVVEMPQRGHQLTVGSPQ